uniref:Nose resistant-to-fluoxetine protein N-terminal domain-containing protein n=1 Tax=Rhipicephalus pulchellus TaxID=72859 RepID=L7LX95_RHIPC
MATPQSPFLVQLLAVAVALVLTGPVARASDNHALLDRLQEVLDNPASRIGALCRNDTLFYLDRLRNGSPWALKMFDSTAKPESGVLTGGLTFLGYYSECIAALPSGRHAVIANESQVPTFTSTYCLATVSFKNAQPWPPKGFPKYLWNELHGNSMRFGLCVPSSCGEKEITELAAEFVQAFDRGVNATSTACSPSREPYVSNVPAISVTCVLMLFVVMAFVGTAYDVAQNLGSSHKKPSSSRSVDTTMASNEGLVNGGPIVDRGSPFTRALLAFSIPANAAKIFNTGGPKEFIQVIHGLRFFSMAWIILGHTFSFSTQWITYRNMDDVLVIHKDIITQGLANGTVTVDTFFFISGLLVVYVTMKQLASNGGNTSWLQFYVHRYWRMTPLMMAVIAFCAVLLPYCGDGPRWKESIATYDLTCKANWWVNAMYLQNFIHRTEMCLNHTWYSAVDFQFYFVSPVVIIFLYRRPQLGMLLIAVSVIASGCYTAAYTAIYDLPAAPYMSSITPVEKMNDFMGYVYVKPYCRIGPFLIGMATGYILHRTQGSIIIRKRYRWLGWMTCAAVMLGVLYAMWPANTGQYTPSRSWAAVYGGFARSTWALGLSWIIIASVAGYGGVVSKILSWKALVPLSRLTFSAYIIHPVLMVLFYGSREESFDYSTFLLIYFAIGNIVLTYLASLVLSLVFEAPIIGMEKLLMKRK